MYYKTKDGVEIPGTKQAGNGEEKETGHKTIGQAL